MLTDFGRGFRDSAALAAALEAHIRAYPVSVARGPGGWVLRLPGRPPYPWRAPRLRLRLRRKQPSGNFGEAAETAALDFILDRWDPRVFYDIGASSGYFAHVAAMRARPRLAIHAFDLRPDLIARIRDTAGALGLQGIEAHLSGMGARDEGLRDVWISLTRLYDHEPAPAEWREIWPVRLKMALLGRPGRDIPRRHRIRLDSIDAFAARNPPPPGLIKMDIDGYEAVALSGGMETFRRHRPVIMLEIHRARFYRRFAVGRPEFLAPLFDLGYSALMLENRTRHRRVRVIPVGPGDPLLSREETDFLILA